MSHIEYILKGILSTSILTILTLILGWEEVDAILEVLDVDSRAGVLSEQW